MTRSLPFALALLDIVLLAPLACGISPGVDSARGIDDGDPAGPTLISTGEGDDEEEGAGATPIAAGAEADAAARDASGEGGPLFGSDAGAADAAGDRATDDAGRPSFPR